jgi:argininosuccinate synthase
MSKKSVTKVVLAYSGGLDTSVIVPWLKENYNCEVICYCGNVGQAEELSGLEAKALASGASKLIVEDLREELSSEYIFPMIHSGAIYERKYLLGTSIARPVVAKHQVLVAQQEGADAVAHGCTGKGNDQVRFELTYTALDPALTVIAPWREWDIKSREDAFAYLEARGLPTPTNSSPKLYSRDRNLWHVSHEGGPLEDATQPAPDDLYLMTCSPEEAPDQPEWVEIAFDHGSPIAVNGQALSPATIIETLNEIGGKHGIGRIDLVENRLVGMKSRGIYETPGGSILVAAHSELESITLDRDTLHFKEMAAQRYAELIYFGQWFTPLCQSLNSFFLETQKMVTGAVKLKLYKGNMSVAGRWSPYTLYSEAFATFGHSAVYDHHDAAGFIKLFALPSKVKAIMEHQLQEAPSPYPTSMPLPNQAISGD